MDVLMPLEIIRTVCYNFKKPRIPLTDFICVSLLIASKNPNFVPKHY
jgi:hypothetical protein